MVVHLLDKVKAFEKSSGSRNARGTFRALEDIKVDCERFHAEHGDGTVWKEFILPLQQAVDRARIAALEVNQAGDLKTEGHLSDMTAKRLRRLAGNFRHHLRGAARELKLEIKELK